MDVKSILFTSIFYLGGCSIVEQNHTKICTKCNIEKSLDQFSKVSRNKDGKDTFCKSCRRASKDNSPEAKKRQQEYNKQYKIKTKETLGADGYKEYRREERQKYFEKYGREEFNARKRENYDPERRKEIRLAYEQRVEERTGLPYSEYVKPTRQKYKQENKEHIKAWNKEYITKNKEILSAKAAAYYRENKELINQRNNLYYQNNKETHRLRSFNTYAKRKNAEGFITAEERQLLVMYQENKCKYCFVDLDQVVVELDHQIPINEGGSNWIENIALTCQECNRSKGAKTHYSFIEFLKVAHPEKYSRYADNHLVEMPLYYEWVNSIESSKQYSNTVEDDLHYKQAA